MGYLNPHESNADTKEYSSRHDTENILQLFLLIWCHSIQKLWEEAVHFLCAPMNCIRIKRLAFLYTSGNAILAPNMEADSCAWVKIELVVWSNPHIYCGVTHKGDYGVDNIPLLESATLFVQGVSYPSLIVESLSWFPILFLCNKLIVTLVGVGSIWLFLCRENKKIGLEFMRLQDSAVWTKTV